MKIHVTFNAPKLPADVGMIVGSPQLPPLPRPVMTERTAQPEPQNISDNSEQFRKEIARRHEAPFSLSWRGGGINE